MSGGVLLGVDEAARVVDISPRMLRRLASSGEIPATRVEGDWVFVRTDLLAYGGEYVRQRGEYWTWRKEQADLNWRTARVVREQRKAAQVRAREALALQNAELRAWRLEEKRLTREKNVAAAWADRVSLGHIRPLPGQV